MSWLQDKTGKNDKWWMDRVGFLIGKNVTGKKVKYKGNWHDTCNPPDWIRDLVKDVEKRTNLPVQYDENMWYASVLSFILMKWWVRLVRAKSYDPRRPKKIRQRMLGKWSNFCSEVMKFMTDESQDPKYFPDQKWDNPFAKEAKSGTYE